MSGKFTLIQQNDTHAQFEAHPELFWHNGAPTFRTMGGYARAATVVRQIREETAGACCFVREIGGVRVGFVGVTSPIVT